MIATMALIAQGRQRVDCKGSNDPTYFKPTTLRGLLGVLLTPTKSHESRFWGQIYGERNRLRANRSTDTGLPFSSGAQKCFQDFRQEGSTFDLAFGFFGLKSSSESLSIFTRFFFDGFAAAAPNSSSSFQSFCEPIQMVKDLIHLVKFWWQKNKQPNKQKQKTNGKNSN